MITIKNSNVYIFLWLTNWVRRIYIFKNLSGFWSNECLESIMCHLAYDVTRLDVRTCAVRETWHSLKYRMPTYLYYGLVYSLKIEEFRNRSLKQGRLIILYTLHNSYKYAHTAVAPYFWSPSPPSTLEDFVRYAFIEYNTIFKLNYI